VVPSIDVGAETVAFVADDADVLTGAGFATCSLECEPVVHPGNAKNSSKEITRFLQHEYPTVSSRHLMMSDLSIPHGISELLSLVFSFQSDVPPGWNLQSSKLLSFSSNDFPQPVLVQIGIVSI